MPTNETVLGFRIYLEDTDAQGIVYYANYLRYFERGRSEFLESFGIPMNQVADPEARLVVYQANIQFRKPVFLGDRIQVFTSMIRESDYRLSFRQKIRRSGENEDLVLGEIYVVAIDHDGNLRELPAFFSLQ